MNHPTDDAQTGHLPHLDHLPRGVRQLVRPIAANGRAVLVSNAGTTAFRADLVPSEETVPALFFATQRCGRLGHVAACLADGITSPQKISDLAPPAQPGGKRPRNSQWVDSRRRTIDSLFGGVVWASPTIRVTVKEGLRAVERQTSSSQAQTHIRRVLEAFDCLPLSTALTTEDPVAGPLDDVVYAVVVPSWFQMFGGLKVGRATVGLARRVRELQRTALPEALVVLRAYRAPQGKSTALLEHELHQHMKERGMHRPFGGGIEWFHVPLALLDQIAASLGAVSVECGGVEAEERLRTTPTEAVQYALDHPKTGGHPGLMLADLTGETGAA